jgi:ABC-type transport system substrate-binding protein
VAAFLLLFALACGGSAAEPQIVEKKVIVKEEVIKEVPVEKEVVVEKEVIREVEKRVIVVATPTPVPAGATDVMAWVKNGKYGGHVDLFHSQNPELWDIHRGATVHTARPTESLYNGLVIYNHVKTDEIICDLCTTWELAADGVTYTFHLNDKAKWSDGMPVTAEDAVFSLDRMTAAGEPRPRTGALRPYYQSSEAVDPHTVKITTKYPASAFIRFLGTSYPKIVPKHVAGAGVDINVPENIVGSGPFTQAGFKRLGSYSFEKNPDYFKEGLPFLDTIKVFIIKDKARAITALLTEQALGHVAFGAPPLNVIQIDALVKDSEGRLVFRQTTGGPCGFFLNFNREPFSDPKVRRAFYLALDRLKYHQAVWSWAASAATTFAPDEVIPQEEAWQWPGHRYLDKDGNLVTDPIGREDVVKDPADIEEAKRLMAEAGYGDGIDIVYTYRTNYVYPTEAPFIKEQMAAIGINLELNAVDPTAGLAMFAEGDYTLGRICHGVTIRDPDEIFTSVLLAGGSRNQLGYEDPRLREIFEKQTRELNLEKRRELLRQAEEIAREGTLHWPTMYWSPTYDLKNVKIKNYHTPPTIHILQTMEGWWLDPDAKPGDTN